MTAQSSARQRRRGSVRRLPSGALQVRVQAGSDALTGKRYELTEVIPPGPKAAAEAEAARTRLLNQVDERRNPRTKATVDQMLDRHFELADLDPSTLSTYRGYAKKHIRPLIGRLPVGALDADLFDSLYAELRRCREHCDRRPRTDHRTVNQHACDDRCRPHTCRPLGDSTVRQVHFILSGALRRAVRWRWIGASPIGQAEPPPAPKPDPRPPTAEEAARILQAAWSDPDWALLLWLAMVTGVRRGELCALRWSDIDTAAGVLSVRRSIWQRGSQVGEKDTKDHQKRRIALDAETLSLVVEHRARWEERVTALETRLADDAFVFSGAPDGGRHLLPDSVSQRYGDLVRRLSITTTVHKLRHYSATELIAAGVDPRTVAGRLGHGGGGTTTLRYYTAWVSESDQRAASTLAARMPARPLGPSMPELRTFERVAGVLRQQLAAGEIQIGSLLPGQKRLAAEHGIAVGTAHRAVTLLAEEGFLVAEPGHGFRVVKLPVPEAPAGLMLDPATTSTTAIFPPQPDESVRLLNLVLRHGGVDVSRFTAEGDPADPADLRDLLLDSITRRGFSEADLPSFELDVFDAVSGTSLHTFVVSRRRRSAPASASS